MQTGKKTTQKRQLNLDLNLTVVILRSATHQTLQHVTRRLREHDCIMGNVKFSVNNLVFTTVLSLPRHGLFRYFMDRL